ncbi:MAG: AbrB family transcriptional regulator [Thermoleophilaceae bacterium]
MAAGVLAELAGLPIPWLFGGLVAGVGVALVRGAAGAGLPRPVSLGGEAVAGVALGSALRLDALGPVVGALPVVVAVGLGTLALSVAAGALLARVTSIDRPTAALGLLAGAAPGIVAVSEEVEADPVLVTLMQFGRVFLIVATAPLVALVLGADGASTGGAPGAGAAPTVFDPTLGALVSLPVAVVGAVVAGRLRVPAGGLIGPLVLAAALAAAGAAAVPPPRLLDAAFAVLGLAVGLRFDRETGRRVGRLAPAMLAAVVGVILGCAGLGLVLVAVLDVSLLTAYLATTPGGLSAVLATAFASGADTTIVLAVQALRLLLMVLAAPVAARLLRPR